MTKMNNIRKNTLTANNMSTGFELKFEKGQELLLKVDDQGRLVLTNPNGQSQVVNITTEVPTFHDVLREEVKNSRRIENPNLERRWIMAQTFKLLNFGMNDEYIRKYYGIGWNAGMRYYHDYHYQFTTVLDEYEKLIKMAKENDPELEVRKKFFTRAVVADLMEDYIEKLTAYIGEQKVRRCKGRKYKNIKGYGNVFCDEIDAKIVNPLVRIFNRVDSTEMMPITVLYNAIKKFVQNMHYEIHSKDFVKSWMDAYKGAGAYYTLLNMIRSHGCTLYLSTYNYSLHKYIETKATGEIALRILKELVDINYLEESMYKLHGILKHTIEKNHYDFYADMKEQYDKVNNTTNIATSSFMFSL